MFGLGFIEIGAICIVALVFIRPKDLPRLLRKLGRLYRQALDQLSAVKRVVKDIENEALRGEIIRDTDAGADEGSNEGADEGPDESNDEGNRENADEDRG
jgi:Sec-independent protein translocase protein TatA